MAKNVYNLNMATSYHNLKHGYKLLKLEPWILDTIIKNMTTSYHNLKHEYYNLKGEYEDYTT